MTGTSSIFHLTPIRMSSIFPNLLTFPFLGLKFDVPLLSCDRQLKMIKKA
uniref:Uncharacterized protein n=1 Tax=Caenorhabditis brenneri TaxID=135651 RepID=B6VBH6_CAEBE|nr:hypothetical protein Cbre_JD10.001 [Caenorhabditis brenneri]